MKPSGFKKIFVGRVFFEKLFMFSTFIFAFKCMFLNIDKCIKMSKLSSKELLMAFVQQHFKSSIVGSDVSVFMLVIYICSLYHSINLSILTKEKNVDSFFFLPVICFGLFFFLYFFFLPSFLFGQVFYNFMFNNFF